MMLLPLQGASGFSVLIALDEQDFTLGLWAILILTLRHGLSCPPSWVV